jgi:hypothetical protein
MVQAANASCFLPSICIILQVLAISTGTENGPQMRLLQIIRDLNSKAIYPTIAEIQSQNLVKDSFFLKSDISELLESAYIEKFSLPDQDNAEYSRTGHRITEVGVYALERYSSQVRNFLSSLDEKYEKSENKDLYAAIEANRDLLHFAYYQGWIAKDRIQKMAKKLGINVERVWWGDSQGERWLGQWHGTW